MSWRTVVVSSRCKLDLKMGYMVVRGEDIRRIYLDEIALLMIENPAVSMTGCLLSALMEHKVKVIFCDGTHNPQAELLPYYGCHDTSRKIHRQIAWPEEIAGAVWTAIVSEKIVNQAKFLRETGNAEEGLMLEQYVAQMEFRDASNREGHAAKVYFNALFGKSFTRSSETPVNAALNYGYSVLLAAFNREIAANGYLTQLGLHHGNVFNPFNLSSDLMEPFRPLVDKAVYTAMPSSFDKDIKRALYNLLNQQITIDGSSQTVLNAISIYAKSVFTAMNDLDPCLIKFWSDEL